LTEIFQKNRYNGQRSGCNVSVGRYKDVVWQRFPCVIYKLLTEARIMSTFEASKSDNADLQLFLTGLVNQMTLLSISRRPVPVNPTNESERSALCWLPRATHCCEAMPTDEREIWPRQDDMLD